jgi:hypothetical protein
LRQLQEFWVEHRRRHYLAAADQPDFVRPVIGDRAASSTSRPVTARSLIRSLLGLHDDGADFAAAFDLLARRRRLIKRGL